jgi:6-phosphogluconate dehydrogenase
MEIEVDGTNFELGIIGLGLMGRNLALNIAGQGYRVAACDTDGAKVRSFVEAAESSDIFGTESLDLLVDSLARPRTFLILVPAGSPVEAVIHELKPRLEEGDILIDGGNSHYKDTNRRAADLGKIGVHFLGAGISGGEHGARNGPSIMVGGNKEAYARVAPMFEAAAAWVDGTPCTAWLGPGSVGHYVKMVHNGIESALMQLIAESYDLLKRGLGSGSQKLHTIFEQWNQQELNSYLIEITARIFRQIDDKTGLPLLDVILDRIGQKGTGKWSMQDAVELEVSTPVIDMALALRALSLCKGERESASKILAGPRHIYQDDRETFVEHLKNALYAGMVIVFAQGMAQMRKASHAYGYDLNLSQLAGIWRGGCIIRSAIVNEIFLSFRERPGLQNLLLDPFLGQEVMARQADLRTIVRAAAELGIPTPCFMASLAYYDGYRSDWLPVNLIQAQRNYFGDHSFERKE